MAELIENNKVDLLGEFTGDIQFSHKVMGESFYVADLKVQRTSGVFDCIPIMISDRLFDVNGEITGYMVRVKGQFRSFNKRADGEKTKLVLSVFAREIEPADIGDFNINKIELEGYICKEVKYRETPLGREIADFSLAVNRPYGKSDYIPCICWGRNAHFATTLNVGDKLRILGRIQSRIYEKRFDNGSSEERIAYEVSASAMEVLHDEK